MEIGRRLQPDDYRIEVYNSAGPPGNQVQVNAVFRDSSGVPRE